MYPKSSRSDKWEQLTNNRLWNAFREGQREALSELFLRYFTRLYRYGVTLVYNKEAVKDGIQQLFLKLWKKKDSLSEIHSVEFYLLKSLRRILFRQKEREASMQERNREYMEDFSHPFFSIEDKIIVAERKTERRERLKKAFEKLTDRQKEVLTLRLQYGLKNKEIAKVMDLSHQRVRNIIHEATNRLKDCISSI